MSVLDLCWFCQLAVFSMIWLLAVFLVSVQYRHMFVGDNE